MEGRNITGPVEESDVTDILVIESSILLGDLELRAQRYAQTVSELNIKIDALKERRDDVQKSLDALQEALDFLRRPQVQEAN